MEALLDRFDYSIEDLVDILNTNFDNKNYSREDIEETMDLSFSNLVNDVDWIGGRIHGIYFVNIWQ